MTNTSAPRLSVVCPCYNEEESLSELHRRVNAISEAEVGNSFEIVLIDDGSKDRTRAIIGELSDRDPHVVGVILSKNHGHQLALSAGLHICRGERVLIIDADLQDPPELLGKMMALMDEGADVVYGQRQSRLGESAFKRVTALAFYRLLNWLVDIKIPLDAGDFRLMSRRTVEHLCSMPEQDRFIRGMVSWIGFRQVPLLYERQERYAGVTKYPLRKMIRFAIDAISGFSIVPLKLSTYLGFACSLLGLFFLGYTAHSYLTGIAVQGWTTLMAVVLVLGSGQLLVLGVIGEYLGRIYNQSKNRPLFIIEDVLRAPERPPEGEPRETKKRAKTKPVTRETV